MKFFKKCLWVLAISVSLNACAQSQTQTTVTEFQKSQVTIGPSAKYFIEINDVASGMLSGNMMRARISATNTSELNKEIIYQFLWFDEDGFELPGTTSKWRRLRLTPKQDFNLQSVATSVKAYDFQIIINKFTKNN